MTTGRFPEPVIRSRSSRVRLILDSALIFALVGLWLWLFRTPYSNWFYAIIALALGLNAYRTFREGSSPKIPTSPPLEIPAAAVEGIFAGVSGAIVFFTLLLTMSGERYQWTAAMGFGAFMGIYRYRWERGKRTPWIALTIVIAVGFVLGSAFILMKLNAKH